MSEPRRVVTMKATTWMAGLALAISVAGLTAQQGGPPPTGAPFDPAKVPAGLPEPKTWTAQQDHQNMMEQLGIKALRPGPSGNEQRAESRQLRRGDRESVSRSCRTSLTLKNGKKVTTADDVVEAAPAGDRRGLRARSARPRAEERPEGHVDGHATQSTRRSAARPVVGKQLVGHVDNSSYPAIDVDIQMTLVTPADAKGRCR